MSDLQKVLVLCVALGVIGGGMFFAQYVEAPSHEGNQTMVNESEFLEFKHQLEERVRIEIGQPIEGYEPAMFMQVFPGMRSADFDGVEAMIGHYIVVNGTLVHDLEGATMIHSAAPAVSEAGIKTLLQNILDRLAVTERTVDEIIAILSTDEADESSMPTPPSNPIVGGHDVEIYNGVSVSSASRSLDLSDQGLSGSLKAEIRLLTKLEYLDVSNNAFTGLPAEIGQLTSLQTLNLSNNSFTGLPHELGNLSHLTYLNLSGNDISEFDLNIIKSKLTNTNIITDDSNEPIACTMDAKICPDGSAVGRVGPNCEFAACPAPKTVQCTDEMKQATACTREYRPVCGLVQVQCITTPCDPIPETFSNGCTACVQGNVISYTEGQCTLEAN